MHQLYRLARRFFGCSLILGSMAVYAQSTAAPPHLVTRNRYTIQSGDKIDVQFRYTPELNQTVVVQPDGYVNLETIGEVQISGLTLTQATDLVTQKSSAHLRDPRVTLALREFHKPFYVVAGEVGHPGRFDLDQPTTALQAILNAGGLASSARSSQVIVFRRINQQDDEVHMLDLHKVTTQRDLEHDTMLEPGDMILVPRNRIAKIDRIIHAANTGLYFAPSTF